MLIVNNKQMSKQKFINNILQNNPPADWTRETSAILYDYLSQNYQSVEFDFYQRIFRGKGRR